MRIIVGVTGTTGVEMSYELLLALRRAGTSVYSESLLFQSPILSSREQ